MMWRHRGVLTHNGYVAHNSFQRVIFLISRGTRRFGHVCDRLFAPQHSIRTSQLKHRPLMAGDMPTHLDCLPHGFE